MADDDQQNRWEQVKDLNINKKVINKRVKRAEDVTVRHTKRFILKRWDNVREVRRHIIIWIFAMGLLIVAAGMQLSWFHSGYITTGYDTQGTYAEATLGNIDTLNPIFSSSRSEEAVSRLLFSRLYSYDTTGNLLGDLATKMKVDPTGKIYTLSMRSDASWTDGYRLTARDVAFTIDLLSNSAVRSTNPEDWSGIKVKVLDDNTIQFTLPAIIAAFPHALTFAVLPEHVLSKFEPNSIRENEFSKSPVTSGPFKLAFLQDVDSINISRVVNMDRNPDYYGGQARLSHIQIHAYESQDDIIKALDVGEVNAAADLSISDMSSIDASHYEIDSIPVNNGVYALMNQRSSALGDKNVREALVYATDTEAIRKQLGGNLGELNLPFIKGQITGSDIPIQSGFDIKIANKILDNAGWKLSDGVRVKGGKKLELNVVTLKDADYARTIEILSNQWHKIGVNVKSLIVDTNDTTQKSAQDIIQTRSYDILLYKLTIGADPDVFAYWHSSQATERGSNFSNYSNTIADEALASARSRLEPALRNSKYITFIKQWAEDVPAIALYQSTAQYVHSKKVVSSDAKNKFVSSIDRYADVMYWSVGEKSIYKTP